MHKTYAVEFKALPSDDGVGRFKALVSVFGNVDSMGDRVMPEAFDRTIETWRKSGDRIPVIWSHDWGNPYAHIGSIDPAKMESTKDGLVVEGDIDLTNAFAAQVHSLMKRRLVKEFSFGYKVHGEHRADDGANDLTDLEIIEVGPTLKGANPATELRGIKAELALAAGDQTIIDDLRSRLEALEERVGIKTSATAEGATDTEQEATEATSQEPEGATDQEPESPNAAVLALIEEAEAQVRPYLQGE